MRNLTCLLIGLMAAMISCSSPDRRVESCARTITVDGDFQDWEGIERVLIDSQQEMSSHWIDFRSLRLSNDRQALHLYLDLGRETIWQNDPSQPAGNDIRIYLDTDSDPSTGLFQGLIGVDYEIRLGFKLALLHTATGTIQMSLNQAGVLIGPTHSSNAFELKIPFLVRPDFAETRRVIGPSPLRLQIWESTGDDRLPATGSIFLELADIDLPPVDPLSLEREDPSDLRVLSHNIHYNKPLGTPQPFRRYLEALQPDIVNLQEVWLWDAEETRRFVAEILDPQGVKAWHVAKVEDCVTVSRWPILENAAVDGNLVSLIDLPPQLSSGELVLFNAHTPCCGHNDRRDYEHDNLSATWRDLMRGVGPFPVEQIGGVIMAGDFNMVGYVRQLLSLRDGNIFNNQRAGPDFRPDKSVGSLRTAPLRHTHSRAAYSWRNDSERYPPGRLDYIFYGPGHMTLKNNFTLYTPDIPYDVLEKYGLQKTDSLVSDHLVQVADFEFPE